MGEEAELSVDSFVDVVANTVGVLIILTVLMIAATKEKAVDVDVDLKEIQTVAVNVHKYKLKSGELDTLIEAGKKRLAVLEPQRAQAQALVSRHQRTHDEVAGRLDKVKKKARGLTLDLDQLGGRRKGYDTAIADAGAEMEKARADFGDAVLSQLARKTATDINAEVVASMGQEKAFTQEAEAAETKAAEFETASAQLEESQRTLEREVSDLRVRAISNIEVRNPTVRSDFSKLPVFFECCVSSTPEGSKGPQCVRALTSENYVSERKGRGQVFKPLPGASGEPAEAIGDPGSKFFRGLADLDKGKRYLHFLVRPDAYAAFRRAAEAAARGGWDVRWDPIEAGRDIVLGGSGE